MLHKIIQILVCISAPTVASAQLATVTGHAVLPSKNLDNVQVVDATLSRGGLDVGNEINLAYAELPPSGGTIYIYPTSDGSCYSFTTPIVLAIVNKFPRLEGMGTSQNNGAAGGACLNYTPTSGTAITLDYVSTSGSPFSSSHGLKNITLINNGCATKGGCGGTAIGISNGSTNAGMYEATMDSVSIIGFATGWSDLNDRSVQISWFHPKFHDNATAMRLSSQTNINFFGGQMAGNGTVIKTNTTTSTPDVACFGTSLFNNSGLTFDATATTSTAARFDGYGCHFENSATDPGNFISGLVNVHLHGGVVEDDAVVGTNAWFFSVSGQEFFTSDVEYVCGRTCTQVVLANSPVRGILGGNDRSPGHFVRYVGGANASFIGQEMLPGSSSVPAAPFKYESLFSPTVEVGTGKGFIVDEAGAPPGIASKTVCHADSGAHVLRCSYNNGTFYQQTQTIASGTANLGTTSITAGTCAKTVTVSAMGVATTDSITWSFNSDPGGIRDYPSLDVKPYPTANSINFRVCNSTTATLTPGAATLNWRVVR